MKKHLLVFSFYTILTLIVTWPLILNFNSSIIDRIDGLLITWFLNWDLHLIPAFLGRNIVHVFGANIFYPSRGSLLFSETMFPQAIISWPLVKLSSEPLLAFNINYFLGFILTAMAVYFFILNQTNKFRLAFVMGLVFSFSSIHLNYMSHLQLFNLWPLIFTIHFVENRNYKLFILFFTISCLTTAVFFYFLLTYLAIKIILDPKIRIKLIFSILLAVICVAPFLVPYYWVSKHYNYTRPITDTIHFSLQFPDLLNISNLNRLSSFIPPTSKGTPAFFGLSLTIIILFGLIKKFRNTRDIKIKLTQIEKQLLTTGIVSFILSFGPALHIFTNTIHVGPIPAIPLPYLILYYIVPGFSGFRTPSRWIILASLSLTLFGAIAGRKYFSQKILIILSVLVLLEIKIPFSYYPVPRVSDFPSEQVWLKNNFSQEPIIQFPIYRWDNHTVGSGIATNGEGLETLREYYSTIHWHPMYNGFSGFSPKEWEEKVAWLQKEFPSNESLAYLQSVGIKLILVPVSWEEKMGKFNQVFQVTRFPDTIIYRFHD